MKPADPEALKPPFERVCAATLTVHADVARIVATAPWISLIDLKRPNSFVLMMVCPKAPLWHRKFN
jgi:hypothetical protein